MADQTSPGESHRRGAKFWSVAALVILEVLSKAGRPLSELRKDFERYADSGEINTEVADPAATVDAIARCKAGPRSRGLVTGPATQAAGQRVWRCERPRMR